MFAKTTQLAIVALVWSSAQVVASAQTSLKQMYDQAGKDGIYDRYIVLETGETYTGGLYIGRTYDRFSASFVGKGENVRIVGNGAVLDLQGSEICMAYCNERLDIDNCVILDGTVRFRGYDGTEVLVPHGSVRYVTFYRPHDYGVRLFGCGDDILIERNIIVDPLSTGPDFMYLTGELSPWLPTGTSVALSLTDGRQVFDNWSYHSDAALNGELLWHFSELCDYG